MNTYKIIIFSLILLLNLSCALALNLKDIFKSAKNSLGDLQDNVKDVTKDLVNKMNRKRNGESGVSSSGKQLLSSLLDAFQKTLQKSSTDTNNLQNIIQLMQIIQQYQNFMDSLRGKNSGQNDKKENSSFFEEELMKSLLGSLTSEENNSLMNSFFEHLSQDSDTENNEKSTGIDLKNLASLIENIKIQSQSSNNENLKIGDFLEWINKYSRSNSDENQMNDDIKENSKSQKEEINVGLIVILSLLGFIILIILLMTIRRYYNKKKYISNRMVEHKPLASTESEKL